MRLMRAFLAAVLATLALSAVGAESGGVRSIQVVPFGAPLPVTRGVHMSAPILERIMQPADLADFLGRPQSRETAIACARAISDACSERDLYLRMVASMVGGDALRIEVEPAAIAKSTVAVRTDAETARPAPTPREGPAPGRRPPATIPDEPDLGEGRIDAVFIGAQDADVAGRVIEYGPVRIALATLSAPATQAVLDLALPLVGLPANTDGCGKAAERIRHIVAHETTNDADAWRVSHVFVPPGTIVFTFSRVAAESGLIEGR